MTVDEVVQRLEGWFPPSLAESWDNTGLLLGDRAANVNRIMTCLTITSSSAQEAIDEHVDLIVAHHPIFFKPVQKLTAGGANGFLYGLARAGIAVYSPHTSFDSAAGGINDQIAARLGLSDVRPLRPAAPPPRFKLVVFVPESDLAKVQAAVFAAGAGVIGAYSECSFRLAGTGSFFGSDQANPVIGQKGRREEVAEQRLEVVVPGDRLSEVVSAMRAAHSYEEPAFDVYPLHSTVPASTGAGRIGDLAAPLRLDELAAHVKQSLRANLVQYVGAPDRRCQRVAIGCGAAAEFLADAVAQHCSAFITGEARFHQYLQAEAEDIGLVLGGHYATERFAVEALSERLAQALPEATVWASRMEHDPARTF